MMLLTPLLLPRKSLSPKLLTDPLRSSSYSHPWLAYSLEILVQSLHFFPLWWTQKSDTSFSLFLPWNCLQYFTWKSDEWKTLHTTPPFSSFCSFNSFFFFSNSHIAPTHKISLGGWSAVLLTFHNFLRSSEVLVQLPNANRNNLFHDKSQFTQPINQMSTALCGKTV